jgi:hypothetical protein
MDRIVVKSIVGHGTETLRRSGKFQKSEIALDIAVIFSVSVHGRQHFVLVCDAALRNFGWDQGRQKDQRSHTLNGRLKKTHRAMS